MDIEIEHQKLQPRTLERSEHESSGSDDTKNYFSQNKKGIYATTSYCHREVVKIIFAQNKTDTYVYNHTLLKP